MTITISRIKPCGVTALFGAFLEINIFHSSHTLQRQQLCGFQPHASVDVTTCKHEILETCHSVTFYFIFFSLYSLSNSPISIPIADLESSLKLPSGCIIFICPPYKKHFMGDGTGPQCGGGECSPASLPPHSRDYTVPKFFFFFVEHCSHKCSI